MINNIIVFNGSKRDFEKLIKERISEENTSRMALTIIEEESSTIFEKACQILSLLS